MVRTTRERYKPINKKKVPKTRRAGVDGTRNPSSHNTCSVRFECGDGEIGTVREHRERTNMQKCYELKKRSSQSDALTKATRERRCEQRQETHQSLILQTPTSLPQRKKSCRGPERRSPFARTRFSPPPTPTALPPRRSPGNHLPPWACVHTSTKYENTPVSP